MIAFGLAKALACACLSAAVQDDTTVEVIGNELVIEWKVKKVDLESRVMTFTEGATALYGPTKVVAERIVIDAENETGLASGKVVLTDPLGSIECAELFFDYRNRIGRARDVDIAVEGTRVRMASIEIKPDRWEVIEPRVGLFRDFAPDWEFGGARITLTPGRQGTIIRPSIYRRGVSRVSAPNQRFNLDRRTTGLRPPSIDLLDGGVHLSWSNSLLLTPQTSFAFSTSVANRVLPTTSLALTWSSVPSDRAENLMTPRSDLEERFVDSYLDNVSVPSIQSEMASLGGPRQSISLATSWNVATVGRPQNAKEISKPWEAVAEIGDDFGLFRGYVQTRVQRIRPDRFASDRTRANVSTTLTSSSIGIGHDLGLRLRADAGAYLAGTGQFGWTRGLVALDWNPSRTMSASLGYSTTGSTGNPQFPFDDVRRGSSLIGRIDFVSGPYGFRLAAKCDPRSGKVFDRQYQFSLVAGAFEPFITLRENPRTTIFGIRLRFESLLRKLQRRQFDRNDSLRVGVKED